MMLMNHNWRNIKRTDEKNEIIRQAQKKRKTKNRNQTEKGIQPECCEGLYMHRYAHLLVCISAFVYFDHSDSSVYVCLRGRSRATDIDRWG